MWGICFLILVAILFWHAWRTSVKRGLGIAILLSLLVPTWVVLGYQNSVSFVDTFYLDVDLRIAMSFIGIPLLFLIRPRYIFPLKFHWLDALMLGLVTLHIVSDSIHDGFSVGILGRAYGEWCLPYLVGRLIICNIDDVKHLLNVACLVSCVLAVIAAVECFGGINLEELAFGERPEDGASRDMKRWGYKRSFGPNMHSIYFGTLQLLLIPWGLFAAITAFTRGRNAWHMSAPVASVIGVAATLSRGPILALGVVAYLFTWIFKPKWSTVMIVIGFCLAALAVVKGDQALRYLEEWSGETNVRKQKQIEVDGERVQFTGTKSRFLMFQIYGPAMQNAGLTGFGTEKVTGFPIKVPTEEKDPKTLEQVRAIDNIYALLTLRFGFLAPILFIGLGGLATYTFIKLAIGTHDDDDPLERVNQKKDRPFYAGMAAVMIAAMLVLLTVWMPHDFGFVFVMYIGIAAGMGSRAGLNTLSK